LDQKKIVFSVVILAMPSGLIHYVHRYLLSHIAHRDRLLSGS